MYANIPNHHFIFYLYYNLKQLFIRLANGQLGNCCRIAFIDSRFVLYNIFSYLHHIHVVIALKGNLIGKKFCFVEYGFEIAAHTAL